MKLFFVVAAAVSLSAVACAAPTTDDTTDSTEQAVRGRRGRHNGADDNGPKTGPTQGSCPAGYELEIEHGVSSCKPHGTPSAADGGAAPSPSTDGGSAPSTGGASAGSACTTNADCAAGLECEVEIEHGVTTSQCKAHRNK
jgi:hypothetical protein